MINGKSENFWLFVTDSENKVILHEELFQLYPNQEPQTVNVMVPVTDPVPPVYFVKFLSDKWLQCEHTVPISFANLILPDKFPATRLLQTDRVIKVERLNFQEAQLMYQEQGVSEFGKLVSDTFKTVYHSNSDLLVGAPDGASELKTIAELAILKQL